jgi:hypothetical protein
MDNRNFVGQNGDATNGKLLGGCTGKGFMPGKSGNPKGRSKGLSRYIRENTDDGQEIAEFFLKAFRGEFDDPEFKEIKPDRRLELQIEAAKWLTERGWGKPTQYVGVDEESAQQLAGGASFSYQEFAALSEDQRQKLIEAARIMEQLKNENKELI